MFLAGANTGLHDGAFPVGNGFHLEQPALMGSGSIIAGKLRHGKARMAVLVLHHMVAAGENLSLNNILGVGNSVFVDRHALDKLHWTLAERSGDGQFIETQRRSRRLKAGSHFNGRVHTDGNGDGQRLI